LPSTTSTRRVSSIGGSSFACSGPSNTLILPVPTHSDIKPDNILLDEKGHAHLTDFNIAVHFTERRALTSVAGSMAYMAPEVLTKRGYTYTVDWWSLGVTGWELLFGKRPFRGKTNSALTQCILRDPLRLPEQPPQAVSDECISFLKGVSWRRFSLRISR